MSDTLYALPCLPTAVPGRYGHLYFMKKKLRAQEDGEVVQVY